MGSHLTNAYIFEQSAERSKFFVPSFNFLTFQCDECVPEIDNFFSLRYTWLSKKWGFGSGFRWGHHIGTSVGAVHARTIRLLKTWLLETFSLTTKTHLFLCKILLLYKVHCLITRFRQFTLILSTVLNAGRSSPGTAPFVQLPACSLPLKEGPCNAKFYRFFYNLQTKRCSVFVYGGCRGNNNNFESAEECQNACGGVGFNYTVTLESDLGGEWISDENARLRFPTIQNDAKELVLLQVRTKLQLQPEYLALVVRREKKEIRGRREEMPTE